VASMAAFSKERSTALLSDRRGQRLIYFGPYCLAFHVTLPPAVARSVLRALRLNESRGDPALPLRAPCESLLNPHRRLDLATLGLPAWRSAQNGFVRQQ